MKAAKHKGPHNVAEKFVHGFLSKLICGGFDVRSVRVVFVEGIDRLANLFHNANGRVFEKVKEHAEFIMAFVVDTLKSIVRQLGFTVNSLDGAVHRYSFFSIDDRIPSDTKEWLENDATRHSTVLLGADDGQLNDGARDAYSDIREYLLGQDAFYRIRDHILSSSDNSSRVHEFVESAIERTQNYVTSLRMLAGDGGVCDAEGTLVAFLNFQNECLIRLGHFVALMSYGHMNAHKGLC